MNSEYSSRRKRQAGCKALLLAGLAFCGLVAGNANAQWVVTDPGHTGLNSFSWGADYAEQAKKLKVLQDQYKNLQEQYQQMQKQYQQGFMGSFSSSGQSVGDSEIKPQRVAIDLGMEKRCRAAQTTVNSEQLELCQEIVRTSNTQFNYAVKMYETTADRTKRLREIEQERKGLSEQDQGKLQDNTNKLLALQALVQIDMQQAQTNTNAFEKRLRYLNEQQVRLTKKALEGGDDGGLGGIGSDIVAGMTLKAALEAVKTNN